MVKNATDREKFLEQEGAGVVLRGGTSAGEMPVSGALAGGVSMSGVPMNGMPQGMPESTGLDMEAEKRALLEIGIDEEPKNLGFSYITLRSLGVNPQAAFKIVNADRKKIEMSLLSPPPTIGKINNKTVEPKSFYSPEEVDKLTQKDLADIGVLEDVMKSMTQWKSS